MSQLIRDVGYGLQGMEERQLFTCSASAQGTAPQLYSPSSNAACGVSGRTIDRLRVEDFGGRLYRRVELGGYLYASRGSTEADRKLQLAVKLQHGDSSAGGDAVDLTTEASTGLTFFTSAQTTPMGSWSTGAIFGASLEHTYDLTAAKRFITPVLTARKNRVTTETSGDEHAHFGVGLRFAGADEIPHRPNSTGPGSTSTSTST